MAKFIFGGDIIESEVERLKKAPPRDHNALKLINLRKLRSINSWMHNVEKLVRRDEPCLLIHPKDAATRSVVDGTMITLSSKWGRIDVKAKITDEVRTGCVAYPHGWGHKGGGWSRANSQHGANLNGITPSTSDMAEQVSGMSYLEGFDVEICAI